MLIFNEHGYLVPDEPIEVDLETFVREFVFNEHRALIFEEYKALWEELSELSLHSVFHWIDGSFVTRYAKPNDIDVVIFLNYLDYERLEPDLRKMREWHSRVDLYFVKNFPQESSRRFVTDFDRAEWLHLFSTDRRRRKKGFVQIKF